MSRAEVTMRWYQRGKVWVGDQQGLLAIVRIWAFPLKDTEAIVERLAWQTLANMTIMNIRCQEQSWGGHLETMTIIEVRDDGGLDQGSCSVSGKKWPDCGYILKVIANSISCSVRGGMRKKEDWATERMELLLFWDREGMLIWGNQEFHESLLCFLNFQEEMSSRQLNLIHESGVQGRGLGWRRNISKYPALSRIWSHSSEWGHQGVSRDREQDEGLSLLGLTLNGTLFRC